MELLEVVRRQEHREGAVGAVLVGDGGQEQRRRRGVGEAHRVVVDLLDLGRRAVGVLDPARQGRRQLLVEQHVVVPEQDVVGAERLAVRPLRALAQLDRPDLVVGRRLGRLGDLGLDLGAVGREAEQRVVDHAHVVVGVGRPEESAAPHAAILAAPSRPPAPPADSRGRRWSTGGSLPAFTCSASAGDSLYLPPCANAVSARRPARRRRPPIRSAFDGD